METRHYNYTVILEPEEGGGYHAFVPALRGCLTQGDTIEQVLERVQEAIEVYLASLRMEGESIPVEDYIITWVKANS